MGKGHERLHDRTRTSPEEMERRWDLTFGKKSGTVEEDPPTTDTREQIAEADNE